MKKSILRSMDLTYDGAGLHQFNTKICLMSAVIIIEIGCIVYLIYLIYFIKEKKED